MFIVSGTFRLTQATVCLKVLAQDATNSSLFNNYSGPLFAIEPNLMFVNRNHAGQMLAKNLSDRGFRPDLVVAIPPGGAPVADEIAEEFSVPIEVLVTKKICTPFNSGIALGAVCEKSTPVWNERLLSKIGLQPDDLGRTVQSLHSQIDELVLQYRAGRPFRSLTNLNVVIVDEGISSGATMTAAVKHLKEKNAKSLVIAVPVVSNLAAKKLRLKADKLVTVEEAQDLASISHFYDDFEVVSENEVISILNSHSSFEVIGSDSLSETRVTF